MMGGDYTLREEALRQAVAARHEDETPRATVERAEKFYEFLRGDEQ